MTQIMNVLKGTTQDTLLQSNLGDTLHFLALYNLVILQHNKVCCVGNVKTLTFAKIMVLNFEMLIKGY